MAYPEIPHFSYPFHFHQHFYQVGVSGHVVEQDSIDDIVSCVEVIVRTPKGTWVDDPDFGILEQTFAQKPDLDGIMADIVRSEPRVDLETAYDTAELEDFVMRIVLRASGSTTTEARGAADPYA